MAEYQNLFTRVQVSGPPAGVPLSPGNSPRSGQPQHIHLLGLHRQRADRPDLPGLAWAWRR
jgi:hypothetical protein